MSLGHGAKIVTDGLKFLWDPNSVRCTQNNRTGVVGSYSATSYYTNAITGSDVTITGGTPMYVSNKTYYTLVGLTYPEGSQAAPWASRDGITPGISNTTAGKLYSCSRDLNYFVFDEDTNTWVANSYFNGERIEGHCYDTYDGAPAQHATFQADFDNISRSFPNATHIVIGSHAAENNDNDSGTLSRLQSIGLPDSHIGVARPEYVLVGKVNRPSTWHYVRENYNSNIAILNVGLPLEGDMNGGAVFNGAKTLQSSIDGSSSLSQYTIAFWAKRDVESKMPVAYAGGTQFYWYGDNSWRYTHGGTGGEYYYPKSVSIPIGAWGYYVATYDGSNVRIYRNGVYEGARATTGTANWSSGIKIGNWTSSSTYSYQGEIANVQFYDKALTDNEVKQNFNALRGRFGI